MSFQTSAIVRKRRCLQALLFADVVVCRRCCRLSCLGGLRKQTRSKARMRKMLFAVCVWKSAAPRRFARTVCVRKQHRRLQTLPCGRQRLCILSHLQGKGGTFFRRFTSRQVSKGLFPQRKNSFGLPFSASKKVVPQTQKPPEGG